MSHRTQLVLAVIGLALVHGAVLFAGFLAPYDPAQQNRALPFVPPTRVHMVDANGSFHLRPFAYAWTPVEGEFGLYREDTTRPYPLQWFVCDDNESREGASRQSHHLFGIGEPAKIFLLGSDGFGRDQFSRLLLGGRISLLAGLIATALSLVLGTMLGAFAGFYGGKTDDAIMRAVELSMALPWLYLLFTVRALLPLRLSATEAFLVIAGVMGAVGWARPARVVRGVVLSAKERMFVLAARGFGATDWYLLRRHILPQAAGVVLTQAALLVPQYILGEVTLSFLGVGAGETTPSWGTMLGSIQYHVLTSYWWMAVPAFALVPVFFCYHVLAVELQYRFSSGT
jgi:peptide/nickel transport system permease protein